MHVECKFVQPFDTILNVDTDHWVYMVYEAAGEAAASLVPQIFAHMNDITTSTGQVVESRGELNADVILDMYEKISISFDENGEPELPLAVVPPAVGEQLRKLPPLTPEQEARRKAILMRKKQEFDARRRVRKLDRDA